MWSTMMSPQGHNFNPAKQPQRDFGLLLSPLSVPIATGKSFKNPNFVNKFDKYQTTTVKPVDSSTNNYQNSCQSQIIDSIKEQCPEVIPSVEKNTKTFPETTTEFPEMCLGNHTINHKTRPVKRGPTQRRKRQFGRNSKQNQKRQEIKEMLQEDDCMDTLNNSTEICPSPRIPISLLKDFITLKLSPTMCSPSKTMVQSIPIPISNTEMVLTITKAASSPNRHRQYSVTDSEDSFIIFDHNAIEECLKENEDKNCNNKESLCNRLRKPSVCESEDSFILFEHDDAVSQEDDESDYCFDSSDEDDDQESECPSDWNNESHFDETDSSFSIVQPKKVRFASDHKLCTVHPMIQWSYAYQAARMGPWEMYARDRCRFKERAYKFERDFQHVFDPRHRERIYKERFETL